MVSADKFFSELDKYADETVQGISDSIGEYTVERYTALINTKHTGPENPDPVLTGFSRFRWQIGLNLTKLPRVSPPVRDANASYPKPAVPSFRFKDLVSTTITNDADYINEIDEKNLIVSQADLSIRGRLDEILKKNW